MSLYQPYKRGKRGRSMRLLRDISDREKHRRIVPAVTCATAFRAWVTPTDCTVKSMKPFPTRQSLYVGAKLVSFTIVATGPNPTVKVEESAVRLRPSVGRGVAIMEVAHLIRTTTREILTAFEPLI
jgi:hypothetical protein